MRSFIAAIAFAVASARQTAARKPLPMPAKDYGYEEPKYEAYEPEYKEYEDDYDMYGYEDDYGYDDQEPWQRKDGRGGNCTQPRIAQM